MGGDRDMGPLAQLGERLLCKQEVGGSIPPGSMTQGDEVAAQALRLSFQFSFLDI